MLWFKFTIGLKFFNSVLILVTFVLDYDNQHETMKNKNQTVAGLKKIKAKIKLNHNIYIYKNSTPLQVQTPYKRVWMGGYKCQLSVKF